MKLLLFLLFALYGSPTIAGNYSHATLTLRNRQNNLVSPSTNTDRVTAFILAGSFSCLTCYHDIASSLRSLDSTLPTYYFVHMKSTSALRRLEAEDELMGIYKVDGVFYDSCCVDESTLGQYLCGLFKTLRVKSTPALILCKGSVIVAYLTSEQLFSGSGIGKASSQYSRCRAVISRSWLRLHPRSKRHNR